MNWFMYFINYKILRRKLYVSSIDDGSSKPEDINEEANRAVQWYLENRTPIFITGSAGTGKSHLIKRIYNLNKNKIAVTASTGIASINLGDFACTIHKLLGLKIDPAKKSSPCHDNDKTKEKLLNIETIIIDEVSMLSAKTIDQINNALRFLTGVDKPFGAKQVIFFGDLYQLPPVIKGVKNKSLKDHFFYKAEVFDHSPINIIVLKKNYRQKNDGEFLKLLDSIKQPKVSSTDINQELEKSIDYINNKCNSDIYKNNEQESELVLTAVNDDRKKINNIEIAKLEKKLNKKAIIIKPIIKNSFGLVIQDDKTTKQEISNILKKEFELEEIKILPGAKIIFTKNTKEYANGTLGTINKIRDEYIEVLLKDKSKIKVEKVEYKIELSGIEHTILTYPIKLAWAITVHKSQGLTLDKYKINIGNSFTHGLTYVALSRATSIDSINLVNKLKAKDVLDTFLIDVKNINKDTEYCIQKNLECLCKQQIFSTYQQGRYGEELFYTWYKDNNLKRLEEITNIKNIIKIKWVNRYVEKYKPYDFLVIDNKNNLHYIEIKTSRFNSIYPKFHLGKTEQKLRESCLNKENQYFIINIPYIDYRHKLELTNRVHSQLINNSNIINKDQELILPDIKYKFYQLSNKEIKKEVFNR